MNDTLFKSETPGAAFSQIIEACRLHHSLSLKMTLQHSFTYFFHFTAYIHIHLMPKNRLRFKSDIHVLHSVTQALLFFLFQRRPQIKQFLKYSTEAVTLVVDAWFRI